MNCRVLKKSIAICWIILVACFIIKALGGNWFANNLVIPELETNVTAICILSSITSYCLFSFYYMAICEVTNFKIWIHIALIPYFFGITLLKVFVVPQESYILLDILSNFVLPALLVTYKNKWTFRFRSMNYFRIIIAFCLSSGFQTISVLVKDAVVNTIVIGFLPQMILAIDVLIMLVLYWLYSLLFKKEVNNMGLVFTLLLSEGKDKLSAMLDRVNAKLEKDPSNSVLLEEKAEIEKALSVK